VTAPAAIAEVEAPGIATATFDPARVVAADCRTDLLTVDGASVGLTYETTAGALLDGTAIEATTCESPIALPAGEHRIRSDSRYEGYVVDRVVLSEPGAPPAAGSPVPVEPERDDTRDRRVAVDPCPTGCWVVLGEGYNDAWEATADGTDLGPVQLIDGGFNGWWLPPTDTSTTVEFRWTAQRPVTFGLFASVAAAGMCLLIVAITRRRGPAPLHMPQLAPIDPRSPAASFGWRSGPGAIAGQAWLVPLVLLLCGGLLIQPVWGIVGGVVGLAALLLARPIPLSAGYLLGCIGVGLASFVALAVVWVERRDQPLPNAGWTASFDQLGGVAVFAVLCVAVGAMATPRPTDRVRSSCAR
jgi:arabinofuranan 3-O-arabinosyltransferase